MNAPFDPYHRWLSIPPHAQPADHYRLLGLVPFESDPEVIRDAAEQRMAHVRTYQLGPHAEASQKILNELAEARACLLDAEDKAEYDRLLQERLTRASPPPVPPVARAAAGPIPWQSRPAMGRAKGFWTILGGSIALASIALAVATSYLARGSSDQVGRNAVAQRPATAKMHDATIPDKPPAPVSAAGNRQIPRPQPGVQAPEAAGAGSAAAPLPVAPPATADPPQDPVPVPPAPLPQEPVPSPQEPATLPEEPLPEPVSPPRHLGAAGAEVDASASAEANLKEGLFLCLVRDDWANGLPKLATGSDERLKTLASSELEGETTRDGQLALGDGWWEAAEKETGVASQKFQHRAAYWYRQALPGLKGAKRLKVVTRLNTLDGVAEEPPPAPPPAAEKAPVNLSGLWRSSLGALFRVTDRGDRIEFRLQESEDLARGEGLMIRKGDQLVVKQWRCVFKADPRRRFWDLRFSAEVFDEQTLSVQYEMLYWDARWNVTKRTFPNYGTWKKMEESVGRRAAGFRDGP